MNLSERSVAVHERLLEFYGEPTWRPHLSPLEELISTILSQNTNDNNRDMAFERLKERFSSWEAVRDAPPEEVVAAIRPAGLANQKGPRIQAILRSISDQRDSLDIEFLSDRTPDEARKWLKQFKGVGPKTAAIVLLFALDMPAFPVDTHIHRVTGRLGLRPPKMNAEKTHQHMEELLPSSAYYAAHLNIIRLGREICKARGPECPKCPLQDLCDYYAENYSV
jgi:endonuclease-3